MWAGSAAIAQWIDDTSPCLGAPPHPARHPDCARLQATLSSRNYLRGDKFDPENFSFNAASLGGQAADARMMARGRSYSGARAAYGDYQAYPEGRPIFMPEAERFGNPPDLPSLLLQQRVIYISMPVSLSPLAYSPTASLAQATGQALTSLPTCSLCA